jgi:putative two-component system response regulator
MSSLDGARSRNLGYPGLLAGSALDTVSGRPERVLVVDDEELVRRMIERMVTAAGGLSCDTAADAAEAKSLLRAHDYALVICDLNMPGESGVELTRWITTNLPDVAVVMATGVDDPDIASAAIEFGAYGYMIKPFKRHEVAINVANALRRRRLEIENRHHRTMLEHRVEARTRELRNSREETIRRLSLAIEFRSKETGEHVERIGEGAGLLARNLGLQPALSELIRVAAPLHDVGKIGIPDDILLKPGPLTDGERARMQDHAGFGHRLLSGSGNDLLETAATIALTHHERWDGSGYPRGLCGEEIPIEGRVTAVVDVFDAVTHDRVYRPAMPVERALDIVRSGRGSHFDPLVVDAFFASLDSVVAFDGNASPQPAHI